VSDDYTKETKEFAVRMLTDIVQLAQDRPGVLHRIRATAHNSGIGLDIDVDLVFDTLFPDRSVLPDLAAWEIALGVQQESAEKLACLWAKQDPADAVERLLWLREEREQTYGGPQDWDVFVCERVAAAVRSPLEWARELIAKRGDHRYIVPFVRRAAEVDEPDWVQAAMQCFEDEASLPAGIVVALTVPGIPDGVFQRALAFPGELAGSILNLRMRREIPEDRMRMLIEHEDCTLARVALFAEWEADGEHSVSDSLKPAWRGAVVRCAHGPLGQTWDYDLVRMFGGDIDLFVQWLRQRLAECAAADDSVDMWSVRGVVAQVAPALDTDTRLELLGRVPLGLRDAGLLGIIANLVGDDLEAYRHLLASDGLKDYHLAPLEGDLDGTWEGKALLALGKGYGEAEIAGGSRPSDGPAVWGSISEQMRAEAERFEHLLSHDDPRIVRVGELGRDHAVRAEGGFRRMEHDRDVRGWDR